MNTFKKKLLISGGSGLVGMEVSEMASKLGYEVCHLTRKRSSKVPYRQFEWDIEQHYLEEGALQGTYALIHLAGAGIADERWTESRKRLILESRLHSTGLLLQEMGRKEIKPEVVLCASASGYYPQTAQAGQAHTEDDPAGEGFLSEVTKAWENETDHFRDSLFVRTVQLRIGIVLSRKGGALPEMARPVNYFSGAPIGTGEQIMPWIHLKDLARMFLFAIEQKSMNGAYNACAPHAAKNSDFTRALGKAMGRPILPVHVPAFALKLMLGEMAEIVLKGTNMSSGKIEKEGFKFEHSELLPTLKSFYA